MEHGLRWGSADGAVPEKVRGASRLPVRCRVTYSGASAESLFISDGTMTDLSETGWGLRGKQPVHPGMILTLWVHHPDDEDFIMIDEVSVAWVKGNRFGVRSLHRGIAVVC